MSISTELVYIRYIARWCVRNFTHLHPRVTSERTIQRFNFFLTNHHLTDPDDVENWSISSRGAGYLFGKQVSKEFCQINDLDLIARAHQLVMEGYIYWHNDKVVTVWSAPNYCYRSGNVAAIMQVGEKLKRNFKVFKAVEDNLKNVNYKNVLPYFLWSFSMGRSN